MYETIVDNLSALTSLVSMNVGGLMAGGDYLDTLHISAIALILVLLAVRMLKRKRDGANKAFGAGNTPASNRVSGGFFAAKRPPALKPCPNCNEQMALSALVCDSCDYNFLAERPGRGQKLLPPPPATSDEVPEQIIAFARH